MLHNKSSLYFCEYRIQAYYSCYYLVFFSFLKKQEGGKAERGNYKTCFLTNF